MKQFLLNQTMDDADEGCLGGLVFHWYCIVNSRPKSHSDSQPTNPFLLSSFLLFLTSCTPLSLSFPSRIAASSLPFVYRIAKLFTKRKLEQLWPPFLRHLSHCICSQTIFLVFACFNIYIYLLSGLLCTDYVPRISYLFIYFSSFRSLSLFRRLARANRSFLSFLLSRDDSIT